MQLFQFLRDNTHEERTALERHPMYAYLSLHEIDLPLYQHILSTHFNWYLHTELELTRHISIRSLNHIKYRFKTPALQYDLKNLNKLTQINNNYDAFFRLRSEDYLAPSSTHWLGVLYVLDNVALWGEYFARHINNKFENDGITHFFEIYKDRSQIHIANLMEFIDSNINSPEEADALIRGAQYAFKHFQRSLDDYSQSQAISA